MRVKPHHHPCGRCGAKTECGGVWEQNYDGWPEVVCSEFHVHLNASEWPAMFLCELCEAAEQAESVVEQAQ